MNYPDRVCLEISFPELGELEATEKLRSLHSFAKTKVPDVEFVADDSEGHLGVGMTFIVMVTVPIARILWREYFVEHHPRQSAKVRFDIDGKSIFEGYMADPDVFPTDRK